MRSALASGPGAVLGDTVGLRAETEAVAGEARWETRRQREPRESMDLPHYVRMGYRFGDLWP